MNYKPLALMAATLLAGMLSLGGVQAANVMTSAGAPAPITPMQNPNIQLAHHHHHHGSSFFLGFGLSPFYSPFYSPYYYQPYYYRPYYYRPYYYRPYYYGSYYSPRYYAPMGGSRHVRWCLNHYRTYSVRSNTFVGFDGYRHRCRSPYRY